MGPADYARPELSGVLKGELIMQFLIFFIPSMIFAYLADPQPLSYIGFKSPQKKSFLPITIITIIVAYFTVSFLGSLDESIVHLLPKATQKWIETGEDNVNGILENILTMKKPADMIMPVFLVGVLAGCWRRSFFQGNPAKIFYPDVQICVAGNNFHRVYFFSNSYAVYGIPASHGPGYCPGCNILV